MIYKFITYGCALMRKILDKMFVNIKAAILIPLLLFFVIYFVFVLFGATENKMRIVIITPLLTAIWFWGIFFIIYIQVKSKSCHIGFLNFIELFITAFSVMCFAVDFVLVTIVGLEDSVTRLCFDTVTYAAVALAHSKRTE